MNYFQYKPISGPLSGSSMVTQTEDVFNGLLVEAREVKAIAQEAHDTATEADATARDALDKGLQGIAIGKEAQQIGADALGIAKNAQNVAEQAIVDAARADSTGLTAEARAVVAQKAADIALASAREGVSAADDALAAAERAEDTAQAALDDVEVITTDLTDLHGRADANTMACDNLLVHTCEDETRHPDTLFQASENLYLPDAAVCGIPAASGGHLAVRVDAAGDAVIQRFTDNRGNFLQRIGTLTGVQVSWSPWRDIEIPDHDATMAVDAAKRIGVSAVSPVQVTDGAELRISLATPLCHVCRPAADLTVFLEDLGTGIHKATTLAIVPQNTINILWSAQGRSPKWTTGHKLSQVEAGKLAVIGIEQVAGLNLLTCLYDEAMPEPAGAPLNRQRKAA